MNYAGNFKRITNIQEIYKKHLAFLITEGIQIKTTLKLPSIPARGCREENKEHQ